MPNCIQLAYQILVRTHKWRRPPTRVTRGVVQVFELSGYWGIGRKQVIRDRYRLLSSSRLQWNRWGSGRGGKLHSRRTRRRWRGGEGRLVRARTWLAVAIWAMLHRRLMQIFYCDVVVTWKRSAVFYRISQPLWCDDGLFFLGLESAHIPVTKFGLLIQVDRVDAPPTDTYRNFPRNMSF